MKDFEVGTRTDEETMAPIIDFISKVTGELKYSFKFNTTDIMDYGKDPNATARIDQEFAPIKADIRNDKINQILPE